ncbi:HlyD family efflux transporter periplasmic adaptor subunit [Streptococcus dentapri]|uniref:HlyD family efflux transporter periplasmic adaptor subunit n=1 Tax=Streptococcus dentapri TaxID=573564 RepID=A0ABV8D2Q5_9STRE
MDPKLFESAEFYKRRYHNFATLFIVPLVCFIIFLVVFLCYAKKEVTVTTTGEIAPTEVLDVIQSYSSSPITENNLTNNATVKKDDLLVRYSELENENQNLGKNSDDKKDEKHKEISASQDGVIHTNPKYEGANLVPQGTEIAQLYPDIKKTKQVLITYYVSSDDVVSMKKGQTTRLSLEKKGNEKVSIKGKINNVASSATTTKEGNVFKVTAKVKLSKEDSKFLKYGMQGNTVTVVAKKTYFNYFKDKLLHKLDEK